MVVKRMKEVEASTREKLLGRRFSGDEKTDSEGTVKRRRMKGKTEEKEGEGKRKDWMVRRQRSKAGFQGGQERSRRGPGVGGPRSPCNFTIPGHRALL